MPSLDASVLGGGGSGDGGAAARFAAVAVGNTRVRVGRFEGGELVEPRSVVADDVDAVVEAVRGAADGDAVVMSTVDAAAADALERRLGGLPVHRIGRDVPVPMPMALDDVTMVGQDRVLCALAAWTRAKTACVVVDAGTAVTVDFVDGEGTFQGGAIVPGVGMMLASLRAGTAALPEVVADFATDPGPFGKDTPRAMLLGVRAAVRGAVRELIDGYAVAYDAYPPVVATGGDVGLLEYEGSLVEHVVPDLQLMGIRAAVDAALADDDEG